MARTGASRVVSAAGMFLAVALTVALVGALGYAFTNLPELQERAAAFKAGVSQESLEADRLDRAADDAISYADDLAERSSRDTGSAGDHEFSHPAPPGVDAPPAHWCAAQEIGYRIDFTRAIDAGSTRAKEIDRWEQAFAVWTEASGGRYTFTYLGPATYELAGARSGGYPIDPPLVPEGEIAITYADPGSADYRHPDLADALGIAGVGPVSWSSGPGQGMITRGMIVLDAQDAEADPRSMPVQYRHEAGHALGLSHTADSSQLMYSGADSASVVGVGDRAGIRKLAGLPCS